MIQGSNDVHYTPVDGYGVATYADNGIISGGNSGSATIVGSTRFFWVYDPNNTETSGFTGNGWFTDIDYSPISVFLKNKSMSLEQFLDQFDQEVNPRTNLDDVFTYWQDYVDKNPYGNYPANFAVLVGANCFTLG